LPGSKKMTWISNKFRLKTLFYSFMGNKKLCIKCFTH